ncbi:hypothetical protein GWK47_029044 [Chionoecetes opilio]|uniref:Uncharacterized protein n=1 Tax=Chionoecetes opilio TaxID=41210 RepID=A0A8J4YWT4_CHIOP|nr:hypothetical protein GWK47_029044 [Chionoecetes opilio]
MECRLEQWACRLTTTHKLFNHDQPLTAQHFAILAQDKNLRPCLAYLVRQVVPPDQARLIKLNLKHARIRKSLREEGEEPSSLREYLRLSAAVGEARAALRAETSEILLLNQQKEELHQGEVEARRKACLVRVARQDSEQQTRHCDLWSAQLRDLQDTQHSKGTKANKASLAIKGKVHEDLLEVEKVHHALLSSHATTVPDLHQMKEDVWERIGDSFEAWSGPGLMEAVVVEAREAQHGLRTLLQGVDLARDARNLRVKMEGSGTFMGEGNPYGALQSVGELLRGMSGAHVRLHLRAHQEHRAALSLSRALNTLNNNINTTAKRSHEDEDVAAAVLALVKASCGLSGERAALGCVAALTATLQGRADAAAAARLALRDTHTRITQQEKEIAERVENIQCVAASIQGGREAVRDLLSSLHASVGGVLRLTTTPTPAHTCLAEECGSLTALPLAHLLTTHMQTSGEHKQKVSMTTTPLVWHPPEATAAAWTAAAQLCPGVRCWEGVCEAACQRLHFTTTLLCQMDHLTSLHTALGTASKQRQAVSSMGTKELLKQVESHDEKVEQRVVEMAEEAERLLTQGFQLLSRFTRTMTDWWEQPAKKIEVIGLKQRV